MLTLPRNHARSPLSPDTRPRVLMTTEGTYPFVMGGVSTWCDFIIRGLPDFRWQVVALVAGDVSHDPTFVLPQSAELVGRIEAWSEAVPRSQAGSRDGPGAMLAVRLVEALLSWDIDAHATVSALVWCRLHPREIRSGFRHPNSWAAFLAALDGIVDGDHADASGVVFDLYHAGELYRALYWIALTAAFPTPPTDVLHVTAAGWAAIPALVHKALYGTPLVLTEHGVYVREAYLAGAMSSDPAAARFVATRMARGLALATYHEADVIAPVTEANARWEAELGVDPARIHTIPNGVFLPPGTTPAPGSGRVVSIGRIDPLKDIRTLLRVAKEVLRHEPGAQFLHYGPVSPGQERYAQTCFDLHAELGLGDGFRFMGSTSDPLGAYRDGDVAVLTSISEGLPISLLEAMSVGRPVVATAVGGVAECIHGSGFSLPPGDVDMLAMSIVTLLRNRKLATLLGTLGRERVARRFSAQTCLSDYRDLLSEVAYQALAS